MSWLNRLAALVGRRQSDQDLNEELQHHIDLKTQEHIEAGMTPEEARYAALRAFGGIEQKKEQCRDADRLRWLEDLTQDLRYGLQQLRRNPGFAAVAIITLALGIGANTAVFSLIDAVMLRTLAVQKPDELMQVRIYDPHQGGEADPTFTNPLWEQIRDQQNVFSGVFAWADNQFDLARGGTIEPADGSFVSGDFFPTLGLRPAAGRLITASDDYRGCPPVAVLSYGFWQGHYGGARGAVGSILPLNEHPFEVIGVAPRGFYGMDLGGKSEVFVPICTAEILGIESLDARSMSWLNVAGRIKPGISRAQLIARLRVLSPRIFTAAVPQYWPADRQRSFEREKLVATSAATGTSVLRQQFDQPLLVLMAIVGLVLLIACANIASLMLTRAAARE
jgi:predicted permease